MHVLTAARSLQCWAQDIPWRFDLSPAGIVCSASVRRFLGLGEPACLFFRRVSELLRFRRAPQAYICSCAIYGKLPTAFDGTFQDPISATSKAYKDEVEVCLCHASTGNAINSVMVSLHAHVLESPCTHMKTLSHAHAHKHRSVVVMYTCYSWIFGHLFAGGTLDPTGGLVDKCRYDIVSSGSRHHRQSCRLKEAMERPLLSTD